MKKELTFAQKIRRLNQQSNLFGDYFETQERHYDIAKKLYQRNGFKLVLTCGMCPEQYDVFSGKDIIAYYRVRHGEFVITCPDVGGEDIFWCDVYGDGGFDKSERLNLLALSLRKVKEHYR